MTLVDCSPTWVTQPPITSSTVAGSTPVRSSRLVRAKPSRSAGCQLASAPPRLPKVVRSTSTITASRVISDPLHCRWRCAARVALAALVAVPRGSFFHSTSGRAASTGLGPPTNVVRSPRAERTFSTSASAWSEGPSKSTDAVLEDNGLLGQLERPVDLLLDHQEGGPGPVDLAQPVVDGVDHHRGQAQGELVGHEQAGRDHQHLGQREEPLLAARQGPARAACAAGPGRGTPRRRGPGRRTPPAVRPAGGRRGPGSPPPSGWRRSPGPRARGTSRPGRCL